MVMDDLPAPMHPLVDLRTVPRSAFQDRSVRVEPGRQEAVEKHGHVTAHLHAWLDEIHHIVEDLPFPVLKLRANACLLLMRLAVPVSK